MSLNPLAALDYFGNTVVKGDILIPNRGKSTIPKVRVFLVTPRRIVLKYVEKVDWLSMTGDGPWSLDQASFTRSSWVKEQKED